MSRHDDGGEDGDGFSLRRWSRRKLAAARTAGPAEPPAAPAEAQPQPPTNAAAPAPEASAAAPALPAAGDVLPPVESLTFDSDFSAFLKSDVDAGTKRAALRRLFSDPRFNVMDGLDVYIDDYSKPDPIAPEIVRELAHARSLFAPAPTRVNVHGYVEDVPEDERTQAAAPVTPPLADAGGAPLASDATDVPKAIDVATTNKDPGAAPQAIEATTPDRDPDAAPRPSTDRPAAAKESSGR